MMRGAALALGACLLLLAGCETVQRTAWQTNLPGSFAPETLQGMSENSRVDDRFSLQSLAASLSSL